MNRFLLFLLLANIPAFLFSQENLSPHYLFPSFEKGRVLMKGGKINTAVMNYNTATEEMIYDQKGQMLALDKLETIDTIYLNNRKFIPAGKIFYELVYKAPASLYIQHKINLNPSGKASGYGGTTQTSAVTSINALSTSGGIYALRLPDNYIVSNVTLNWILVDNSWHSFLNERQLTKIFPDKKDAIKNFVKKTRPTLKRWKIL